MKATMALLGSGEFDAWMDPIDAELIKSSSNPSGEVLILPTASSPEGDEVFDRWGGQGLRHYEKLGAKARVVNLKTKDDAYDPKLVSLVKDAALIFFSGGNPFYVAEVLRNSPFWEAVQEGITAGISFAGCSAGVNMLGNIAFDSSRETFDGQVFKSGLRFFPDIVFGPHWDAMESYMPGSTTLITAAVPPGCRFIGIDEDTALVGDGRCFEIKGKGNVVDGQNVLKHGVSVMF